MIKKDRKKDSRPIKGDENEFKSRNEGAEGEKRLKMRTSLILWKAWRCIGLCVLGSRACLGGVVHGQQERCLFMGSFEVTDNKSRESKAATRTD